MKNFKLETRIVDLQEYIELTGYGTAEAVFEEFGFVAQEYAYTVVTTEDDDLWRRCFAPIICGNYEEAVARTVTIMVEDYKHYINITRN